MALTWDTVQESFDKVELPSGRKYKVASYPHIKIHKLSLHLIGKDIDIQMMKGGQDLGINTQYMDDFGMWEPNGDWWIGVEGTTDAGDQYYHVLFIPQEFEIDGFTLRLKNNDDVPRRMVDGRIIYSLPQEEVE